MGSPQQNNQQQKNQKQPQSEQERDGRMDRDKQQNEQQASEAQPRSGEESEDPVGRRNPDPKADKEAARAKEANAPGWFAKLPPEVRDYFSGGHYEKIPSTYRYLIDHYNRWLNKKRAKKSVR